MRAHPFLFAISLATLALPVLSAPVHHLARPTLPPAPPTRGSLVPRTPGFIPSPSPLDTSAGSYTASAAPPAPKLFEAGADTTASVMQFITENTPADERQAVIKWLLARQRRGVQLFELGSQRVTSAGAKVLNDGLKDGKFQLTPGVAPKTGFARLRALLGDFGRGAP